jgi:hypothetical protein
LCDAPTHTLIPSVSDSKTSPRAPSARIVTKWPDATSLHAAAASTAVIGVFTTNTHDSSLPTNDVQPGGHNTDVGGALGDGIGDGWADGWADGSTDGMALGWADGSTDGCADGAADGTEEGGGGGMLGITKLGTGLVSTLAAGLTFTLAAADACGLALADGSPTTASTSHTNGSSMLADPVRSSKSPKYT